MSLKNFSSSCKKSIEIFVDIAKMTVQTRNRSSRVWFASTPMHPTWTVAFKESKGNYAVGWYTMAVSQIQSVKEVDTIFGTFTILASLWAKCLY